jgi:hypothetical protein
VAPPDFKAVARRHYQDALYLLEGRRWPNADHLAGVAAECGLKAMLLDYLGATLDPWDMPVHPQATTKRQRLGHVNQLWGQLPLIVRGRSARPFTGLLTWQDPFNGWDIADRYSDGKAVSETDADGHVTTAGKILLMIQQAEVTGSAP